MVVLVLIILILGLIGTFEGYVPTATDLYLRGNNIAGFTSSYVEFDAGQITCNRPINKSPQLSTTKNISFVGYNYINFELNISSAWGSARIAILKNNSSSSLDNEYITASFPNQTGNMTKSLNLSALQINSILYIRLYDFSGAIYRIWLS